MGSTKLLHKTSLLGAFVVIACGLLMTVGSTTSHAQEAEHWVQLSDGPVSNMAEVEKTINGLAAGIQKRARVCIDNGQYLVVHEDSGTREETEQLMASLNMSTIVEIPTSQCFGAAGFLQMNKSSEPKFPEPPKAAGASQKSRAVRLAPSYLNSDRAQAKIAHAPKVLDNTSVKVLPEVTTQINLSARDINRITCSGNRPVKDVVFSSEKGVTPKIAGNNAFIKFLVEQDTATGELRFSTTPTEMYVICGAEGTIYSMIAIPQDIPSQTVQLATSVDKITQNLSLFKGLSFEKKVLTIVKQAYRAEYPESYTIKPMNETVESLIGVGLQARLVRQIEIEGEGLRVKEYHLSLAPSFEAAEIKVLEKYFLLPEMTQNPVAMAMDTQFIRKTGKTRLIILEQPESSEM